MLTLSHLMGRYFIDRITSNTYESNMITRPLDKCTYRTTYIMSAISVTSQNDVSLKNGIPFYLAGIACISTGDRRLGLNNYNLLGQTLRGRCGGGIRRYHFPVRRMLYSYTKMRIFISHPLLFLEWIRVMLCNRGRNLN